MDGFPSGGNEDEDFNGAGFGNFFRQPDPQVLRADVPSFTRSPAMQGFPGAGNQDDEFNAAGFGNLFRQPDPPTLRADLPSLTPSAAMEGYHGVAETRDFLTLQSAYSTMWGVPSSSNPSASQLRLDSPMLGVPSSSNPSTSQLRLDSLDLNAGHSWEDMDTYEGILASEGQEGGSGTFNPPPMRMRSRSGRGSLGLRPPRSVGLGSGLPTPPVDNATGGAGRGLPRHRGCTSAGPSTSRGRGARRRLEQALEDDTVPPPQVPVWIHSHEYKVTYLLYVMIVGWYICLHAVTQEAVRRFTFRFPC